MAMLPTVVTCWSRNSTRAVRLAGASVTNSTTPLVAEAIAVSVGACSGEVCKLNRSRFVVELELSVATTTDCNGVHCTQSGISSAVLEANALVGVAICSSGVQVSTCTTDNCGASCHCNNVCSVEVNKVVATAKDDLTAESRRQEVNRVSTSTTLNGRVNEVGCTGREDVVSLAKVDKVRGEIGFSSSSRLEADCVCTSSTLNGVGGCVFTREGDINQISTVKVGDGVEGVTQNEGVVDCGRTGNTDGVSTTTTSNSASSDETVT